MKSAPILIMSGLLAGHLYATQLCPDPDKKIEDRFCDSLLNMQDTSLVMFSVNLKPYKDTTTDPACVGVDQKQHPECQHNSLPDSVYMAQLKRWTHDLYTDYAIYDYKEFTHRLTAPPDSDISWVYHYQIATVSTIVALSKAEYVSSLFHDALNFPVDYIARRSSLKSHSLDFIDVDIQGRPTSIKSRTLKIHWYLRK